MPTRTRPLPLLLAAASLLLAAAIRWQAAPTQEPEPVAAEAVRLLTLGRESSAATALWMQTVDRYAHGTATPEQIEANVRAIGGMVACDLKPIIGHPRLGYEIYQEAVKLGALLRPLGNTLYWLPPLNISKDELAQLAEITERAIVNTLHKLPQKGRISHKISNAQTCGS